MASSNNSDQKAQFEKLSEQLERERRSVAKQLEKCKQISDTASISSYSSSTDESFVWRGQNGSVKDNDSDEESYGSGSALVDSCLKVLEERGLMNSSDIGKFNKHFDQQENNNMSTFENRPLTFSSNSGTVTQTVRTTTSRQQYSYHTDHNGKIIEEIGGPVVNGDTKETVQKYSYSSRNGYDDEYQHGGRAGPTGRYGSEVAREPRESSNSSQDSFSDDLTRKTSSLETNQSETSDQSSTQSQTLPRTFGQTPSDAGLADQNAPATMPRPQAKKGNITYNLSMKVGDVRGSGADGNVYIQLFGSEGKTAKIQLRQAGDTRNKFEKGKTYKFTVDTVDIGQLERIKLSHDHRGYGSGFFVDEVEVEVPSRNDRVTFPCNCWLAQDVNDGRTERDMVASQPAKPAPTTIYTVSVRVGEVRNAQTSLYVQLFGVKGETSKIMLRPAGPSLTRFEPGRTYKFTVETVEIGKIERLRMGQDSKTGSQGLFVENIEIDTNGGENVIFPCHAWSEDDNMKDVLPQTEIPQDDKPNVDYHLTIRTGDLPGAGTDAPVFIQIIGDDCETEQIELSPGGTDDMRFDRGRTDKFVIGTLDVGKPHTIRIGHLGHGPSSSWYVNEVIVDIPTRNEHYVYPCNAWLADDQGDGKTEATLYGEVYKLPLGFGAPPTDIPEKEPLPVDEGILPTKDDMVESELPPMSDDQYLPPQKRFPPERNSPLQRDTPPQRNSPIPRDTPPQRNSPIPRDTPPQRESPVPKPRSNSPQQSSPLVQRSQPPVESAPPQLSTPPRSGSPEDQPRVEEDIQQTTSKPTHTAAFDDIDSGKNAVAYELSLKVGDVQGTGTEGTVFVEIIGAEGKTEKIALREADDSRIKFEKGKSYKFTVETIDIGKVEKVRIGHDARGAGVGWYLEELSVRVPSRGENVVFPCHFWLAEDQGDGKLERELSSTQATYHLALATGDVDNGGTNAVPFIQIFGDQGDTGIIELRKEGDSGFKRGKTDFFNVDAVDVGKIEKIRVGHDGRGIDGAWFLEEVVIDCPQHNEHFIFPCHCWLSDVETDRQTEREFIPEPVAPYKIFIRTGTRPGAGTDANVYLQIFGDQTDSGIIDLKQVMLGASSRHFGTGKECKLELETVDVGILEKMRIGHDNSGRDSAWYLDEVMLVLRDQCWVLPCHDWLDENRGDTERILYPETKTFAQEPDLEDLIAYLKSNDVVLIVNAEAYLQHLFYKDESIKNKFRVLQGIPALVSLLDSRNEDVHRGAAGTLRNLSFSASNDENKIAIVKSDGLQALMRLLQRTDRVELKELLLCIIWNLSSCEDLKDIVINQCLLFLVTTYVIPDSGWDKRDIEPVRWTICLRNATGVLRNLSSAGLPARKKMRDVVGLIDALLYIIRLSLGKPGVDAKTVENCVCILRNLSYRLEEEVDRIKYTDTDIDPDRPDRQIYGGPDATTAGCFSKKSKKKGKSEQMPVERIGPNAKEGVALLWQPETISPLLTVLADSSNAETLEAAAGMVHNLTACSWRWSALLRSTVRREKGLPILVELLRVDDDSVIRADATALRNLALDARNKVVTGKYAMKDLVYRLPPGEGSQGISEPTFGAIVCCIHQLVDQDSQNAKAVRDVGGVVKLVKLAKGNYAPKVVKTANQVLISMWNFKETRTAIDKAGWQYTKAIGEEYGQSSRPKAYDDVSLPRSAHKHYPNQSKFKPAVSAPKPTASERDVDPPTSPGYATPFSNNDTVRNSPAAARSTPPPTSTTTSTTTSTNNEPPLYSKPNKKRNNQPLDEPPQPSPPPATAAREEPGDEADSWV